MCAPFQLSEFPARRALQSPGARQNAIVIVGAGEETPGVGDGHGETSAAWCLSVSARHERYTLDKTARYLRSVIQLEKRWTSCSSFRN